MIASLLTYALTQAPLAKNSVGLAAGPGAHGQWDLVSPPHRPGGGADISVTLHACCRVISTSFALFAHLALVYRCAITNSSSKCSALSSDPYAGLWKTLFTFEHQTLEQW